MRGVIASVRRRAITNLFLGCKVKKKKGKEKEKEADGRVDRFEFRGSSFSSSFEVSLVFFFGAFREAWVVMCFLFVREEG